MNITHATQENITGDRLQAIFNRQKELMQKYHHIEAKSGLMQTPDCPINLDDQRGQARIKDFAWRMMEELGEAIDCSEDWEHHAEELVDGLHFLTELTILAGKDYDSITDFDPDMSEGDYLEMLFQDGKEYVRTKSVSAPVMERLVFELVMHLGMMCNCLKNKPWKQTHMKTDKNAFYSRLEKVWITYFAILSLCVGSAYEVADLYLRKSQVNKFRQESKY